MKEKLTLKGIWQIIKEAFSQFGPDKLTKLSGSLAYCTVFSFAPLLVVIIAVAGIFYGREAIEGQIQNQLAAFVGDESAKQLQQIVTKASVSGKGVIAAIIGGITLLIGATTVFAEIQDSINAIWGLKPKPRKGWLKMLKNRLLSFSVIASLGFLLLVSLSVATVLEAFMGRLRSNFPDISVLMFYILNQFFTLLVAALVFGIVFKVLPDAKIRWRDVAGGAIATALLFMIGKFLISVYISKANVGTTYGAAGSLVILLVWVYYSSIILYIGAEITKAYALRYGSGIQPAHYAVHIEQVEVEEGNKKMAKS